MIVGPWHRRLIRPKQQFRDQNSNSVLWSSAQFYLPVDDGKVCGIIQGVNVTGRFGKFCEWKVEILLHARLLVVPAPYFIFSHSIGQALI